MSVLTSSLLRSLGAEADSTMVGADDDALKLRFGVHSVQAGQFMSRWLKPTYVISGVINTGRAIVEVHSEMPVAVESEEEGLAWLAAILGEVIPADVKPDWLLRGECLRNLLPHPR